MSLDNELPRIEATIIACEKEFENKNFNASAIMNRLRGIADPATRTAKGNELVAWLTEKSETIDIERLLELKNQNPDNSRVGELGRRATDYCTALQDIILSVIQTIDSSNAKAAEAKKQALALKDVMAHIKQLFSDSPPTPAQVALPPVAAEKKNASPTDNSPPTVIEPKNAPLYNEPSTAAKKRTIPLDLSNTPSQNEAPVNEAAVKKRAIPLDLDNAPAQNETPDKKPSQTKASAWGGGNAPKRTSGKKIGFVIVTIVVLLGIAAAIIIYVNSGISIPYLNEDYSEDYNEAITDDADNAGNVEAAAPQPNPVEVERKPDYFTDPRDGQKYRAVKIGGNTWMAQNLNYQTSNGSWCYDYNSYNCNKYGGLYDWNTAVTVCPTGWHLSTRQDWNDLTAVAGGDMAGTALKTKSGWFDYGNGTDDYNFSAQPGGSRAIDESFKNLGNRGIWWTGTEYDSDSAYYRRIIYNYDYVYEGTYDKEYGFSVRCVQNNY